MDDKEYQAEYDKALAALEAEESGAAATATPEPEPQPEPTPEPQPEPQPEPKAEPQDDVQKRIEQLEQRLKEAQRWGHDNAAALKRLQQEREAAERAAKKPQLLNEIEGLEEAVKYVAEAPKPQEVNPEQAWLEAISKAHPDVNDLLADDAFFKSVEARRQSAGADWNDPLVAIREITAAKLERAENIKVQAIEQARKDFEANQKQKAAMQVPGGHAGAAPRETDPQADMVKKYQTMSDEEFAKEVAKVTGF